MRDLYTVHKKNYFFCGIGGSGMSALAQVLLLRGHQISGSDRSFDENPEQEKFKTLQRMGVIMHPQDGSGITSEIETVVVSSAVEETIPDIMTAVKIGIPIQKRAEILAELFNKAKTSVAIGGTSGKSTVTAMLAHILVKAGKNPTVVNGAVMTNYFAPINSKSLGNMIAGLDLVFVIEADESDGSIDLYNPTISVVTNITEDHKPITELKELFKNFIEKATLGTVLNADCIESRELMRAGPSNRTFSITGTMANIIAKKPNYNASGSEFNLGNTKVELKVPGEHNISNALAAISAASLIGITLHASIDALKSFRGTKRRMEWVGKARGITVIDDFAHNPDKISATLKALHTTQGKVLVIYQPHGYKPTSFMRKNLVNAIASNMAEIDELIMPEIYFAGGSTEKNISSNDLINDIKALGHKATFVENRNDIIPIIVQKAKSGDKVVIMGARDDSLSIFAKDILEGIKNS